MGRYRRREPMITSHDATAALRILLAVYPNRSARAARPGHGPVR
ncbi:hypothetical protein [Saccharopolyspora hattusasensis]